MGCTRSGMFRFADMLLLAVVFLFQSVILNYIIIWHHSSSIFSFFWFLGDFFCLVLFAFAVFIAHRYHQKITEREQRTASRASYASAGQGQAQARSITPQSNTSSDEGAFGFMTINQFLGSTKLPLTYMTWLFYSFLLIMKICVLFKTNIAQNLPKNVFLGPQLLKFCIGLSTVVFSLLVESHHNAIAEPLRNSYLNSIAFGVALEILDSVSLLSLLIPSEAHLAYSFAMENYIIGLASLNLMLPAVTIYKLSASNFGRIYNTPLETLYKVLHLFMVNLPFLALRLYLWQMFSTDTAIFMIKNLYAIIAFIRGIYPDIQSLKQLLNNRIQLPAPGEPGGPAGNKEARGLPPRRTKSGSNGHLPDGSMQVVYRNERSSPDSSMSNGPSPLRQKKMVPSVSIEDTSAS